MKLLDMRSSEIQLRKLKLRLGHLCCASHVASFTVTWQQGIQSTLVLQSRLATDLQTELRCSHIKQRFNCLHEAG